MSQLACQVDWDQRVAALARCEGLLAGSASHHKSFPELLRSLLRDAISLQIADRWAATLRRSPLVEH